MSSARRRKVTKRVLDTTLVLMLSPLLIVVMGASALAVRVSMGSPIFFIQKRIGLNEQPFNLLKFRTMTDARDAQGKLLPDRERLTRTGRIIRTLSLDELPQLVNVVRGEMALVGPRPLLVDYIPFYRGRERLRHSVLPGITGAAQVAGRNGVAWDDRLKLDADYAISATLVDDVRIIAETIKNVVVAKGVSVVAGDSGERLDVVRSYPSDGIYALRRLELADADTRVAWFKDSRTAKHMKVPGDVTAESTRTWILQSRKASERKDFVVYEQASGAICAMVGTRGETDPSFVEVHVLVDPDRHGQGLGSISMRLLLEWLRALPAMRGCWLTVHPENHAAIRLYSRLGFKYIGESGPDRLRMELLWEASSD